MAAMTPRYRPVPFAHRLLCVLMAWVMFVAPIIVLVGEVHEFEHATAGAGTHASAHHEPAPLLLSCHGPSFSAEPLSALPDPHHFN